jgi:hypothetical protein
MSVSLVGAERTEQYIIRNVVLIARIRALSFCGAFGNSNEKLVTPF